jgi:RNA polymerase sporulation-specific sigma factor
MMQINKVEICGVNTSELPVLKNKEMRELLVKIKNGDEECRQQFVNGNLRLVLSVIQKFNNRGENIDDLFQIGCIGLIKSIDNFDLSQNVRFSTYAVPMIIGEIRRYLRDNNPIRVSRSLKDIAYKALQVRERLTIENLKEPNVSQIAKELDMNREDVVLALDAIQDPISLFDPIYQDNGDAIYVMDQVQDKKGRDEVWIEEIALKEAVKKLNSREKLVLDLRFYKGKTQIEVADEIGISQAQVSRIEKNALKNMRKHI